MRARSLSRLLLLSTLMAVVVAAAPLVLASRPVQTMMQAQDGTETSTPTPTATWTPPDEGVTTRVSVDSAGVEGNGNSYYTDISADGRYVAFHSYASNLVSGDTNGEADIFVHDRAVGVTERVSVDSEGNQGNRNNHGFAISASGRYVAFSSQSTNLVPNDTNEVWDIFVRDRQAGVTTRVSVDSAGNQANDGLYTFPAISGDGRYVAFDSEAFNLVPDDTNGTWDVFVHDLNTGETTRVSVDSAGVQGSGNSWHPAISADGRYIAFYSTASNLVAGDTNNRADTFVHVTCPHERYHSLC